MDEVEKQEKQDLEGYIKALENKVNELAQNLNDLQTEKEMLFDEYINSLHKIYRIGD